MIRTRCCYDRKPSFKPVIDPANAKACLELMKKDGEVFTYVADVHRNAWIVAVSKKKTVVIWLGYDKPASIGNASSLKKAFLTKAKQWAN